MSDSKPGSRTFELALRERFGIKPRLVPFKSVVGHGEGWVCTGGTLIDGVGDTPEEAYVDHVEEAWAIGGNFPDGYPR